jgi:hypothetical protein
MDLVVEVISVSVVMVVVELVVDVVVELADATHPTILSVAVVEAVVRGQRQMPRRRYPVLRPNPVSAFFVRAARHLGVLSEFGRYGLR